MTKRFEKYGILPKKKGGEEEEEEKTKKLSFNNFSKSIQNYYK